MAYADPQTLTVATVANSLPRTGSSINGGMFTSADRKYSLEISHQRSNRFRHLMKLTVTQTVSNPLVPSQNQVVTDTVHLVVDHPVNGVAASDVVDHVKAFLDLLRDTGSYAAVTKLVTGEQ